jgi:carboxyl-terminal processing protease
VKLTILNPKTTTTRDVTLIRASITVRSITWHLLPGTSVVDLRIATFSTGMTEDLRKALLTIEKERITGLILDLRNNPGGLFDEAVSTASQFLSTGNVLLEKNAVGKILPVPVKPGGVATSLPMVVLVNGGTSSGAEIVAGALQDVHRARLIGEKTFGTGTVLQTFSLSDGSALMLAIEEWLTPAGHVIWHQGISPDVVVPLPPDVTPLIPTNEEGLTDEEFRKSKDVQVLRALDLLQKNNEKEKALSSSQREAFETLK